MTGRGQAGSQMNGHGRIVTLRGRDSHPGVQPHARPQLSLRRPGIGHQGVLGVRAGGHRLRGVTKRQEQPVPAGVDLRPPMTSTPRLGSDADVLPTSGG